MEFKHQNLFSELEITSTCPPSNLNEFDAIAFRWVFNPMEHEFNFLPNYIFDLKKNNAATYGNNTFTSEQKCLRCSLSLYVSLDAAKINHKKLAKKLREKLGYTHIAQGKIDKTDGKGTDINSVGHFSFFEGKDMELKNKFNIIDTLIEEAA